MIIKQPSMMGSSKYEFNPDQLDVDVAENKARYQAKRQDIEISLMKILKQDIQRLDETWEMVIDILREIKMKG